MLMNTEPVREQWKLVVFEKSLMAEPRSGRGLRIDDGGWGG
jgi:hypothetical protein